MRGLAERPWRRDTAALKDLVISNRGAEFRLLHVIDALRWSVRLLWEAETGRLAAYLSETPLLLRHIEEGTFWASVRKEMLTNDPIEQILLGEMRETTYSDLGVCPSLSELLWSCAQDPDLPHASAWLCDLVRMLWLFSCAVESDPGEGLSAFAERFERVGDLRDAIFSDGSDASLKDRLMSEALSNVLISREVVGAEFRKTVAARTRAAARSKLADSLKYHSRAFSAFLHREGRVAALSMPVCFTRRLYQLEDSYSPIAELRSAMVLVGALREVSSTRPAELRTLVTALDVVGDELMSENWPYVIAASVLREAGLDFPLTVHAGEAFYTGLNGLRSIDEAVSGPVAAARIGHALALSPRMASQVALPVNEGWPRLAAVMDLCWLAQRLPERSNEVRSLLYRAVETVNGGRSIGPETWVEAYQALFNFEELRRVGLVLEVDGSFVVPTNAEILEWRSSDDLMDAALVSLAMGTAARVDVDWSAPIDVDLSTAISDLHRNAYPDARAAVLDEMKALGVVIEACPTSNLRLSGLSSMGEHPLWDWLDEGLAVTVSTDDPLIFGVNIISEYASMLMLGRRNRVEQVARDSVKHCAGGVAKSHMAYRALSG
ncbi:hypothetical protein GCM10027451_03550 [Geodermatophilus aquaeductus]